MNVIVHPCIVRCVCDHELSDHTECHPQREARHAYGCLTWVKFRREVLIIARVHRSGRRKRMKIRLRSPTHHLHPLQLMPR